MRKLMDLVLGKGGSVDINGRTFSGRNISIVGGKVIVDGVEQAGQLDYTVNVTVNGNAERVETGSGDVVVNGQVGYVETGSGDVQAERVSGSVKTASGDVRAVNVGGSVSTVSGNITRK